MQLPDFAALTPAEQDALEGAQREAWYAWQRGNHDKVAEIAKAYGLDTKGAPPPEVETPEGDGPLDVETPESKPARKSAPGRPRKG